MIKDNKKIKNYECEDFKKLGKNSRIGSFCIHFLKGLKYYLYSIYRMFIVAINTRALRSRKKILRNAEFIALTYFPLVDKKFLEQKKFVNKYYNALQGALEKRHKNKIAWLALITNIDNSSFSNAVKLGRQINLWGYPLYFIEEWITLKGLFITFARYIYFLGKFIKKMPRHSDKLLYSNSGTNIWYFFEDEYFSSFVGGHLMSSIVYYEIFSNMARDLKKGSVMMYFAENQVWEKVLNFALHEKGKTKGRYAYR